MPDTPFGPLESLVGRTFERDGLKRKVNRVDTYGYGPGRGNVFWGRPGGFSRLQPTWLPNFLKWLEKAKEVTQ